MPYTTLWKIQIETFFDLLKRLSNKKQNFQFNRKQTVSVV